MQGGLAKAKLAEAELAEEMLAKAKLAVEMPAKPAKAKLAEEEKDELAEAKLAEEEPAMQSLARCLRRRSGPASSRPLSLMPWPRTEPSGASIWRGS